MATENAFAAQGSTEGGMLHPALEATLRAWAHASEAVAPAIGRTADAR